MEQEIFSYKGDCLTNASIEPLLQKIMEVSEQQCFSGIVKKALRFVTSEILGNIVSHAYLRKGEQCPASIRLSLTNDDTICIETKNFISNDNIESLTNLLNTINSANSHELKELQKTTLRDNLDEQGSPRIGLIMIRRKSCKPIQYKFEPCDNEVSFITLTVEISKNLQDDLRKEHTKRTPQINFDIEKERFEISGVSFPEDTENYYAEIEKWINKHEPFLAELSNPVIKIDLDYFNSSSLKNIVRMVRDLLLTNPERFTIEWYYDVDDEISHEEGMEMSEILHKKFNFISKK
jgi:hypothetical protein